MRYKTPAEAVKHLRDLGHIYGGQFRSNDVDVDVPRRTASWYFWKFVHNTLNGLHDWTTKRCKGGG